MALKPIAIRANAVLALTLAWGTASVHAQSTAVSSVAPPPSIYHLEPLGKQPDVKETKPLVDWLPIWGRDAREKGFDLPLPFGVGLTYPYIAQKMVVSDVKIEGRPLDITIRDAATTTHTPSASSPAHGCTSSGDAGKTTSPTTPLRALPPPIRSSRPSIWPG